MIYRKRLQQRTERSELNITIPLPNEIPDVGSISRSGYQHGNREAIDYWTRKHLDARPKDFETSTASIDDLQRLYGEFYRGLWTRNSLAAAPATNKLGDIDLVVRLSDLDQCVRPSLLQESFDVRGNPATHDCEMTSGTLAFLLREPFARGTVSINSRLQFNYDRAHNFFIFFLIPYANNSGKHFLPKGAVAWTDIQSPANISVMQSILRSRSPAMASFQEVLERLR